MVDFFFPSGALKMDEIANETVEAVKQMDEDENEESVQKKDEKPNAYFKSSFEEFNQMRKAGELTDIALIFDGKRIPCHRLVLTAKSDYFKAMFVSGMKESSAQEIEIQGIDAETGATLVDSFYEGKLNVTKENAEKLLVATGMLLLRDLLYEVETFMYRHCIENQDDIMKMLNLARLHCICPRSLIYQRCCSYFIDSFGEISDDEIAHLSETDMLCIIGDGGDDWTNSDYDREDETKFQLIQKWVHAREGNKESFPKLVKLLDYTLYRMSSSTKQWTPKVSCTPVNALKFIKVQRMKWIAWRRSHPSSLWSRMVMFRKCT
jgi:kelch-like protein 2/3